ncbi:MAG: hypothetical protein SGI87_02670 [Flavobacteriales bacterium]|nr:hypothetical protein [Flavobacteriales bacterium]
MSLREPFLFIGLWLISLSFYAQIPSKGWSRTVTDSIINARSFSGHAVIQPAAGSLDSDILAVIDSSYVAATYQNYLKIKPLFDISGGFTQTDKASFFGNGNAGFYLDYNNKNKLTGSIGASYYAMDGPQYLRSFADSLRVLPGVGYNMSDSGSTPMSLFTFGHIAYKAGKYIQIEAGKGKHFWGDGHRSLVLSDLAPAYPYLRLTTRIWKIKYTNLWAMMKDISSGQDLKDARKKFVALHSLSWDVSKWLNISAFEMVVWQDRDTLSSRTLDLNYLNPVIFYRPVEFAQGSADNVLLGGGFKAKISKTVQMYGQLVLDEFVLDRLKLRTGWWANKFGGQVGFRLFDIFTPGLHIRTEWNLVRPFTYTHGSPVQAWGHLNQPLAHPLGANFYEWVNQVSYKFKKWSFRYEFIWAAYGRDRDELNLGGNVFRSYRGPFRQYDNVMLQGLKSTLHFSRLEVSHPISKTLGVDAYFNYGWRFEKNEFETLNEHFLQIGVRIPVNVLTTDF